MQRPHRRPTNNVRALGHGHGRPTQAIEAGVQVNTQANVITDEQRVAALMTLFRKGRGKGEA
jgi:hypothetical protein